MDIISITSSKVPDVQEFPLHCLPDVIASSIRSVCEAQSLPVQYVGSACLWAVSTLAGRRYFSEFNGKGRNILYILWVGPVSMGKTPSFQVVCEAPLKEAYKYADSKFQTEYAEYLESKKAKDKSAHLPMPQQFIPITMEGTTEGLISKHRFQSHGIGVYYDEAETIFSAGNYKGQNDAISFFTMAFAGNRFQQVRADVEKERVIPYVNINLLMGTQTDRLSNIFTQDRLSSGFAARFLTLQADYKPLNVDMDPFGDRMQMCREWTMIMERLFYDAIDARPPVQIEITLCGKARYRLYNRLLMEEANRRIVGRAEAYLIGAEAKLSAYLPRLCQVLAILYRPDMPFVDEVIVDKAFELYRYFQLSSVNAITKIKTEADSGLPVDLDNLLQMLPDEFTRAEARNTCLRLGLNERRFDLAVAGHKAFKELFRKSGHGKYIKL